MRKVRVLLFAGTRELIGSAVVEVEVPEFATVAMLRQSLAERYPAMEGVVARCAVAVDGRYAVPSQSIGPEAEVALIPPVSGG